MKNFIENSKFNINPNLFSPINNNMAITSIVHNQEAYIGDWMRFHYIAGINDFIIYDDNSNDNTVEIVRQLSSDLKLNIKIIPWNIRVYVNKPNQLIKLENQGLHMIHAIYNYGSNYKWMAFIDTDEYIVPLKHKTIIEAISHLDNYSNISLQYTLFGDNGHISKPSKPDIFAYTKSAVNHGENLNICINTKCIMQPKYINYVSVHKFFTSNMGKKTVNDKGYMITNKIQKRNKPEFLSNSYLQFNHYYLRSKEEYEAKLNWKRKFHHIWNESDEEKFYKMVEVINNNCKEDTSINNFLKLHGIQNNAEFVEYEH